MKNYGIAKVVTEQDGSKVLLLPPALVRDLRIRAGDIAEFRRREGGGYSIEFFRSNRNGWVQLLPSEKAELLDRLWKRESMRPKEVAQRKLCVALPVADGSAGRRALLDREGGCVDANTAAKLYAGTSSRATAAPETVRRAARERRLIAAQSDRGRMLFPVWQFRPEEGGALPALSRILAELARRPGASDITPFLFFLQPQPRLGITPLAALRKGEVNEVIAAAKEYAD